MSSLPLQLHDVYVDVIILAGILPLVNFIWQNARWQYLKNRFSRYFLLPKMSLYFSQYFQEFCYSTCLKAKGLFLPLCVPQHGVLKKVSIKNSTYNSTVQVLSLGRWQNTVEVAFPQRGHPKKRFYVSKYTKQRRSTNMKKCLKAASWDEATSTSLWGKF